METNSDVLNESKPWRKTSVDSLAMPTNAYSLYGLNLTANFQFTNFVPPSLGPVTLDVLSLDGAYDSSAWREVPPSYVSPIVTASGEPALYAYRYGECDRLHIPKIANYLVRSDHIECYPESPRDPFLIETGLLSTVIPSWLERRGILVLHSSAVVVRDRCVSFIASAGMGKSSLAAAFVKAGFPLLTDDALPVESTPKGFVGRPSYPQLRMKPDQVDYFLSGRDVLTPKEFASTKLRVPVGADGFGTFSPQSKPMGRIYILERKTTPGPGAVECKEMSPSEAIVSLAHHSRVPRWVCALGLQENRLRGLADLMRQVTVKRLVYPSKLERLPAVRDAIIEDLRI